MENRDSVLETADRVSPMARLLIENADRIIERAGLSPRLMIDGNPESELRGIDVFPDRRRPVNESLDAAMATIGYAATFILPSSFGFVFETAPAFEYGPFRNRPRRAVPSAQRRQRIARRIERAHRK